MREILFRAKRINDGEWVEGYYAIARGRIGLEQHTILVADNKFGYFEWHVINPETICQYTGLTDKNGNKIWENDICSALCVDGKENCIVRYGRRAENFKFELGFNVEWIKNYYFRCDICYWTENRKLEVIGNIFDNPELLKG